MPETPGPEDTMSISATSSSYAAINAYSYYNDLQKNSESTTSATLHSLSSGAPSSEVSGLLTATGRAELKKALDAMKADGHTNFTFNEIERYRQIKELEFTAQIKEDLKELGVDPEVRFTLVVDSTGKVSVLSDHADKAVIEQYLANNPDMVEDFKHIQALSNLKRTQQKASAQGSEFTRDLKTTLQSEALQAFFATMDNGGQDYFSQIANFNADDTSSWFLGLNQKV